LIVNIWYPVRSSHIIDEQRTRRGRPPVCALNPFAFSYATASLKSWTTLSVAPIILFIQTVTSSKFALPCITHMRRVGDKYIVIHIHKMTYKHMHLAGRLSKRGGTSQGEEWEGNVTSAGAGFFFASSRDNPQIGPTRKCSRQAQTFPAFLGHAASARLCVLAAASGLSIFTQPTRTARIIAPIQCRLPTSEIPRFSTVALSCDRYWQCCFTARTVASLSYCSE